MPFVSTALTVTVPFPLLASLVTLVLAGAFSGRFRILIRPVVGRKSLLVRSVRSMSSLRL
jgi:hypothetical protein